jgi:hypothetical protein
MSTRKSRKSLDDTLASEFVYGSKASTSQSKKAESPKPIEPATPPSIEAQPSPSMTSSSKQSLMSKLMDMPEKEPTVRLTVDLSESMHRKLSILCAKTGKKKAEVVRLLLNDALEEMNM